MADYKPCFKIEQWVYEFYWRHKPAMAHNIQPNEAARRSLTNRAFSCFIMLLIVFIFGCASKPPNQDSAQLKAIKDGRQKLIDTPSPDLIAELVADPQSVGGLTGIWFAETDLSDPKWSAASQLAALPGLRLLRLHTTTGTDGFLKTVASLPQVTTLAIHETDLTDEGLKHIAEMSQLEELIIEFTTGGITEAGLQSLAPLKKLKKLRIANDAGLTASKLKANLPNCQITVEPYMTGTPVKTGVF
jgi:hypothetical protein